MSLAVLNLCVIRTFGPAYSTLLCACSACRSLAQFLSYSPASTSNVASDKVWFMGKWLFNGKVLSSARMMKSYSLLINRGLRDKLLVNQWWDTQLGCLFSFKSSSFEIHDNMRHQYGNYCG